MAILKGVQDRIDVKVVAVMELNNGAELEVPFVVTYKKPTISEARELEKRLNPAAYGLEGEPITDEDLAREYILGWKEVPTETGEPYDFNPKHLAEMLEVREYVQALTRGMNEVIHGRSAVALAKNSSRPGRIGR